MIPIALGSCGSNDEPSSNTNTNTTKDPDGTIVLSTTPGNLYDVGTAPYHPTFEISKDYNIYGYFSEVCIIGPVKGISSVTMKTIPSTGWSSKAAAMVGYGYMLKYTYIDYEDNYVEKVHYAALYVDSEITSTSGGVMGYIIKALPLNY